MKLLLSVGLRPNEEYPPCVDTILNERSVHHRMPLSMNGSEHPDNLYDWRASQHEAFHYVYGAAMPVRQLHQTLHLNSPIIQEEARVRLEDILRQRKQYLPEAFRPRSQPSPMLTEEPEPLLIQLLQDERHRDILDIVLSDQYLEWPLRKRKPHRKNDHHLLPRSRMGANNGINRYPYEMDIHAAFHTVYGNMTPDEQLVFLVTMNEPILHPSLVRRFRLALDRIMREKRFYRDEAFKKEARPA